MTTRHWKWYKINTSLTVMSLSKYVTYNDVFDDNKYWSNDHDSACPILMF
jgi:hypothetical protein